MQNSSPFIIQEPPISGEIHGNPSANKVVVISHGFGVQRDGRGMFAQLADQLKEDYQIVLFDYTDIDEEGNTTVYSFTKQSQMLLAILKYVHETLQPKEVSVVAHSQGCLSVGIADPDDLSQIILLSPPLASPTVERMQKIFGEREGTRIVKDDMSTIKRSDGKLTFVPAEYWLDAESINSVELYDNLADKSNVFFIRAKQDQVLPDQDYSVIENMEGITYIELDGDHDFNGNARKAWLELMVKLIDRS